MASSTPQGAKLLNGFRKLTRFDTGLGSQLPAAYKKFWKEWKQTQPAAVHYIPKEGKWERDVLTAEVRPIQNIPIPVIFPPESDEGIWGGEGVVKGFQKRQQLKRRVPHFWVPVLRRSVVKSEILNEYMSVTVTERTMNLIHDNFGFDHYLLKTPACDLRSTLALKLKRKLLQSLQAGCPELADNPGKQKEILNEYKKYLDQYTSEDIEWYGLTFNEAISKLKEQIKAENAIIPLKIEFRRQLIEQLRNAKLKEADESGNGKGGDIQNLSADEIPRESGSWLSRINPFAKKET